MTNLTQSKAWLQLASHQKDIAKEHMRDWFLKDTHRVSNFSKKVLGITLDYSRNRIQEHTLDLLCGLAHHCGLNAKIHDLFSGASINSTENRPALHTALRDKNKTPIYINGQDIASLISLAQEKCVRFAKDIELGRVKGITGKAIKHIVNIGIGGSFIGPMAATSALKEFNQTDLKFHFISSIDDVHLTDTLQQIDPETTLFIISSKSFSTLETMTNARSIMNWMINRLGENALKHHFIAITAREDLAESFGIDCANIFPLWSWVGGRYSIWSAIGLPLLLMIGEKHFNEFLQGAYEMDEHFRCADFKQNMPVLLALLSIWYMNFFGATAEAIIPYAHRLRYFIPYLQQVAMESNGKSVNVDGDSTSYTTGPILFGEEGVIGQHAYHQLLHQGKHLVPVDFILVNHPSDTQDDHLNNGLLPHDRQLHHHILLASALSQAEALMRGKTHEEALLDLLSLSQEGPLPAKWLANHQSMSGNRPSNLIYLDRLTPKNLGALIAMYEHKIFVQGAIWQINSFDQWGVELGKKLLPPLLKQIQMRGHE
jgi:glucose-6-phosphate isomerase